MIVIVLLIFGSGYYVEHKNFQTYKDEQTLLLKDHNAQIVALNKQLKDNSDYAETQLQDTSKAITDWYLQHPTIRVQPNTCNSQVPSTANSTTGPNGSTTELYASPYSPESTEQVANRLDRLQKLLIKDGVKIK